MEIRYEPSLQDLVESGLEAFRTNKVIRRNTMVSNGLCAFLFGALLYYSFDDFTFSLACLLCGGPTWETSSGLYDTPCSSGGATRIDCS